MTDSEITDGRGDTTPSQEGKTDPIFFVNYDKATKEYSVSPGATRLEVSKDQPRLFISISGEPFLSLSGKYSLEVELHYHAEYGFQPITFREYQSPIDVVAGDQCQYRFFKDDGTVAPEYTIEPFPDRAPKEVSVENGFSSISPGERITRSIAIDAKTCYELESGIQYKLQLPRGQITWWGAGSLEAYTGVKVGLLDKGKNPIIMIPHSNAIDVKVDV